MISQTHPLIRVINLAHSFGKNTLFSGLSFDISAWDILLITGPSGVGKTTLLSLIGGIVPVQSGVIEYDSLLAPREQKFGYALIDGPFFEMLSVRENIFLLENFAHAKISLERYEKLVKYFEIDTLVDMPLISLSAGQRERVNFVRALIHQPRVVILDEPGANLDSHLFQKLQNFIKNESMKNHTSFIMVSHDSRFHKIASQHIELIPH